MKVFSYSQWQYDLLMNEATTGSTDEDVMECVSCGDEIGIGYVRAMDKDKVDDQINTDEGQQCSNCLAMFLSTTSHDITLPEVIGESI